MGIYPKQYDREDFLNFLHKYNVSNEIIGKFVDLPEAVLCGDDKFDLFVNVTFYSDGNTHYNFELNYYSEEHIEFLFNSKVFTNIEISINYLLCELITNGYFGKEKECTA
jgi:hypothetical protein